MTTSNELADWARAKLPQTRRGWAVLVLGAIAWMYLLIATRGDLLAGSIWSVPFLLLTAAVTTPWRSLPFRHMAALFLVGFGPIFGIALIVQWILSLDPIDSGVTSLLETLAASGFDLAFTQLSADLWAPVTEEFLKVLPVLILMRWRATSFTALAGPIDYAVVGGATGAGFALAEDVLVLISPNFLTHPGDDMFGFGIGRIYQNLVGADEFGRHVGGGYSDTMSFFFPEMQEFSGAIWAGHGAYAFALGLTIGLAVWLIRGSGNRVWLLLPAITYFWVTFEHVLSNWYGGAGCNRRDLALCTIADLDLRGRIFPVLILVGVGYAAYLSQHAVGQLKSHDPHVSMRIGDVTRDAYLPSGWRGWVAMAGDVFEFHRLRIATAFGAKTMNDLSTGCRLDAVALLSVRTRALTLRQRLTGQATESPPEGAALIMGRSAPLH